MPAFQHYQAAFTAHLRNPQQAARPSGVNARRMGIYREIVFNNFYASVSACFPVLLSIIGKRRFTYLVRQCFFSQRFESPVFRDISKVFVDFLASLDLSIHSLPPYATQLAHYEWIELEVSHMPGDHLETVHGVNEPGALAQAIVQLQPAHRLLHYDYPVHQLSKKQANLPAAPTYLLVFRKPDFSIRFMQLNAVTYQLLHQIQSERSTISQHLAQFAQTSLTHVPLDKVQAFGLQTLFELYTEQAIIIPS